MAKKNTGAIKWIAYWAARALISLLAMIPIRASCRLGSMAGSLLWFALPSRRRTVDYNLRVVDSWRKKENPPKGFKKLSSKEVFRRTCSNLVAGFSFGRIPKSDMQSHLEIQGLEHVHKALKKGKGAILILAHMGPWELLTTLAAIGPDIGIDAKMGAIYRPLDNDYLDEWVREIRQKNRTTLFSRKDGFYKPAAFIREGGILGILSDQRAGRSGLITTFFGAPAKTTALPGLLHKRTDAPMISLAVETVGLAKWRLTISPVRLPITENLPRAEEKVALARAVNGALEKNITLSPNDEFWLHTRFGENKKKRTKKRKSSN